MFRALPQCNGLPITVDLNARDFPTAGDDVIPGTELGDTINASSGNYTTCSEAGDYVIIGGTGNDELSGDVGGDELFSGADDDTLDGGASAGDLCCGQLCSGQFGIDMATADCEVINTVP